MEKFKEKPFRTQFIECKNGGFHGVGPTIDYKSIPELLPFNPFVARKLLKLEKGLPTIACLRFGGICNSGKIKCKNSEDGKLKRAIKRTWQNTYNKLWQNNLKNKQKTKTKLKKR